MPEDIKYLNNENALDRDPSDDISPQSDASVNQFEHDPDDSVDITAPYDDTKAQAIEQNL